MKNSLVLHLPVIALLSAFSMLAGAQEPVSLIGVTPGTTTRSQLIANPEWGTPQARHVDDDGHEYLVYADGEIPRVATVADGVLRSVDVRVRQTPVEEIATAFRLGMPTKDAVPEAGKIGLATETWQVIYFPERCAVVFVTQQDGIRAEMLRFFGPLAQPPCTSDPASETACLEAMDLLGQFKLDEALEKFDEAIRLDPRHSCALFGRAECLAALGDVKRSLAASHAAIRLVGEDARTLTQYARALNEAGDFSAAITAATKAIALDARNGEAYFVRGVAHRALLQDDQAIADLTRAVELVPDGIWPLMHRADLHMQRGDADAVIADCNAVIELEPQFPSAYCLKGAALSDAGRHQEALASLNRAIELDPRYAMAYENRSRVRSLLGDIEGAQADLESSRRLQNQ